MADYTIPSVYGSERAPAVRTMRSPAPLRGALIGKFAAGTEDVFVLTDGVSLSSLYGGVLPGSAARQAAAFLAQGNASLHICRVKGTAASISLGVDAGTATAKVDGTWANGAGTGAAPTAGIIITASAGTVATTTKIKIQCVFVDGASTKVYTEEWDNLTKDTGTPRYIQTWINAHSKLVVISGDPTVIPAAEDYLLASGVEPDYTSGITALDTVRGNLCVMIDSQVEADQIELQTALNTRSGTYPDITPDASVMVISAPQYSSLATIVALAATMNDERVAVAGVWKGVYDPSTSFVHDINEDCILAGIRCHWNPEQSWTNKKSYGVVSTERALTRANHVTLIEAGVSTIDLWLDDTTRGWRVISGVASDVTQFYVRVAKDWVAAVEISNSAWAVGELQGEADPDPLRTSLKAQSDAFWLAMKDQRRIERYVVKCDAENNLAADVANGICTKDVDVKLYRAADVIKIRIAAGTESVIAQEA